MSSKQIYLPIAEIKVIDNRRWIKKLVEHQDFLGFDTETYKGACKLLCDSDSRMVYNPTFRECIDFLWYKASQSYYRAFWNLDFDISAILKLYDNIELIDKLIHGYEIKYQEYILSYLRPKFFQIRKGHKTISFTDLYFIYKLSLNEASKEFLNQEKFDNIDGNLLNTNLSYWLKNLDDIIKYCIQDCKLTAELGRYLLIKIKEANLPAPKYFSSHASLSKQFFRYNCRIPSVKYIPINILDIAYHTYYGGRFELLQRGYFSELYYYDINSAYPKTIKNLPSLKYGKWFRTDTLPKKETIGFYKALIDIPESYISAFPIRYKGLIMFPHGIFETWLTWFELDLLRKYIIHLDYGYEYESGSKEYYPFFDQIDYLYSKKAECKEINEVFYWLYKIVMVSLYGCFYERHKKPDNTIESGILFNPVYASIITAKTRYQLLKDVGKRNLKYIVGFHTDSVISTKPLNKLKLDDKLGNWSFEAKDEGVLLLSGVYQIGTNVRQRGFAKKGKKTVNWFELLKKFQNELEIKLPRTYVIKIAEALRRWQSLEKVNIFINDNKKLNINSDKKRKWERQFENCKDALENNISSTTIGMKFIDKRGLK